MKFGYESRTGGKLFFLCWAAYFSTYICRLNFSAIMPELISRHVFTESQVASVSSAFFICYGVGQVISGAVGDKISPRIMIFLGTFISAASNIFIFFCSRSYGLTLFSWALNGAVQSMVWSPILRVAGEFFTENEKAKFGVDIATTVPLGTLASYSVSLLTLLLLPWNYVFLSCGIIVLCVSFYWYIGTGNVFKAFGKEQKEGAGNASGASGNVPAAPLQNVMPVRELLRMLAEGGIFVLLLAIAIQGTLKDSVTQWIPTFLESRFNMGVSVSLLLTMLLPVVNVTGAYLARALNWRLNNELLTSAVFFGAAVGFFALLLTAGGHSIILSVACMAGVTNCMFAINVMLITMVPLQFSRYGRASTVGGILNAMAYVGCGFLNLCAGMVLEKSNSSWNVLFTMWLILAVCALVITCICLIPWKKLRKMCR